MMEFKKHIYCCLILFLLLPARAFAQCELPGVPEAAASSVDAAQTASVLALVAALEASYTADVTTATTTLTAALDTMNSTLLDKLDWLWGVWEPALKDMTKQLHAGIIDETRNSAGFNDSSNISASGLAIQKNRIDAEKLYQPTNQACQFDTNSKHISRSKAVSTAMTTGYALDFNKVGNNEQGAPAAGGPASLQQARWQVYQSKFCNKDNNNGHAGCAVSAPSPDEDALPSKVIFSKETIDLSNADTQEALTQMMFNITGYQPPEPILPGALRSVKGILQQQEDRGYIAQMDAAGALAYSVVADRIPVPLAAGSPPSEIQAIRQKMGMSDASPTPSAREVRQAIMEQLWDPNYYKELYDSPATLAQKELYLKAYGLVMLYDMIEKQEKISNVYAIETANMLHHVDHSRHNASSSSPF